MPGRTPPWTRQMGLEEKRPSGLLLTTVEKMGGYARKNSVWPAIFGLACCAIEPFQAGGARHLPPPAPTSRARMPSFPVTPPATKTPALSPASPLAKGAARHERVTHLPWGPSAGPRPGSHLVRADDGVRGGYGRPVRAGRLAGPRPGRRRRHHRVHRRVRLPDRHAIRGPQIAAADSRAAGRFRPAGGAGAGAGAGRLRQHGPAGAVAGRRRHRAVHRRLRGGRVRHPARPRAGSPG